MQEHPRMRAFLRSLPVYRTFIMMRKFGAASPKATWLYSNDACLTDIHRFEAPSQNTEPVQMVTVKRLPNGTEKRWGGRDLKGSQTYPPGFASAISAVYTLHRDRIQAAAQKRREEAALLPLDYSSIFKDLSGGDRWLDADLSKVFKVFFTE